MSAHSRVAERYAKSLVSYAEEQNKLQNIKHDIDLFTETVDDHRELRLILENPVVPSDKKAAVLEKLFSGSVDPITLNLFKIVSRKKREAYLYGIMQEAKNLYNQLLNIQHAVVTSATKLDASTVAELEQKVRRISGKNPELIQEIDPELIGGFVLRVGDQQLDASVTTQLREMKAAFA